MNVFYHDWYIMAKEAPWIGFTLVILVIVAAEVVILGIMTLFAPLMLLIVKLVDLITGRRLSRRD